MLLTRVVLAAAHGASLRAAGMPDAFVLSAAMHTAAVLVNACMRVFLVRAFHRWQRDNICKDSAPKETALSDHGNTEGAEQRGKVKVQ